MRAILRALHTIGIGTADLRTSSISDLVLSHTCTQAFYVPGALAANRVLILWDDAHGHGHVFEVDTSNHDLDLDESIFHWYLVDGRLAPCKALKRAQLLCLKTDKCFALVQAFRHGIQPLSTVCRLELVDWRIRHQTLHQEATITFGILGLYAFPTPQCSQDFY